MSEKEAEQRIEEEEVEWEPGFFTFKENRQVRDSLQKERETIRCQIERIESKGKKHRKKNASRIAELEKKVRGINKKIELIGKRSFMGRLGAGGGALAMCGTLLGVALSGDNENQERVRSQVGKSEEKGPRVRKLPRPQLKPQPKKRSHSPEELDEIKVPSFRFSDKEVEFKKPEALDMTEQEFLQIAKKVSDEVIEFVEKAKEDDDEKSRGANALYAMFDQIMENHPRLKDLWFAKIKPGSIVGQKEMFSELNQYLHPHGHHLTYKSEEEGMDVMVVDSIRSTKHIVLETQWGEFEFPIIEGEGEGGMRKGGLNIASVNDAYEYIVSYPDRVPKFVNNIARLLPDFPNYQMPFDYEFEEKHSYQECLFHEAIHMLLSRLFPKASENPYSVKQVMPLGLTYELDDFKVDLSGDYSPRMFHEMCAFGGQFAVSKLERTVLLGSFMKSSGPNMVEGTYKLFDRVLAVVLLKNVPEGKFLAFSKKRNKEIDLREEVIDQFHKTGEFDKKLLTAIVGHPAFTKEHRGRIGKMLFDHAFRALRHLEGMIERTKK